MGIHGHRFFFSGGCNTVQCGVALRRQQAGGLGASPQPGTTWLVASLHLAATHNHAKQAALRLLARH